MKNTVKLILQTLLGYNRYLYVFSKYKIKNLKSDQKEGDFFMFMKEINGEGDILDIGANIGIMTYHLSTQFKDRKIVAVEPMLDNLKVLKRIINKYKLSNVTVKDIALGNKQETLKMVLPLNGNVKMQGLAHVVHDSIDEWNEGEVFDVECETLDNLFGSTKIAGIKMDIENFEFFALEGGQDVLKKNKPVLYLELWDNENRTQCFNLLSKLGYKTYVNESDSLVSYDPLKHKKQNFIFK